MTQPELLYLSQSDVAGLGVTMPEVIAAVETAFREKGHGRAELPPKTAIHPGAGGGFLHAMPGCIEGLRAAGLKWVGAFPGNRAKGLPYVSAVLILNDVETGLPLAVMDASWITATRTGAATAVAARLLARPESSVVGILGCGVQGRSNLEALHHCFRIEEVRAYDIDLHAADDYAGEMGDRLGLEVSVVPTPRRAVTGCHIVVTAAPQLPAPPRTIEPGWLDPGGFASLVDWDGSFQPAALHEADKFCTDDTAQFRHYQSLGRLADVPAIHADLGELVIGAKPGRESTEERTMTCNLGLAICDVAVASLVYAGAAERGVGTRLER